MEVPAGTLNAEQNQSPLPEPQAVVVRRESERELVAWSAPARPFKRRDKQFFVTTFAMAGIVGLILFLAEGVMPVLLIISLVFLYYILSTVEPETIEYKITSRGIRIAGKLSPWQIMDSFWFGKRFDTQVLTVATITIPGRMEIVINPDIKERIRKEVTAYIPEEHHEPSQFDKLTDWLASKLPGNE